MNKGITNLIKQGESISLEFKETFDRETIETVGAFANTSRFSVIFRKDIYTEEYLRKLGLNERQIKAVKFVKERGAISRKDYVTLVEISPRMAHLDLADLVNKKLLVVIGKGRAVKYALHK